MALSAHATAVTEVLTQLGTAVEQGLGSTEVQRRQAADGRNVLPEPRATPLWMEFAAQFKSPLIWLLLVGALVAALMGERADAAVIVVVLLTNALVGTVQERRAARSMAALRKLTEVRIRVVRDGQETSLDARELVRGDVMLLAAGDAVPADARVVDAARLQCAEAALTGESAPVAKSVDPVSEACALSERTSMVYSGTLVTSGRGRAVVVGTGLDTELGRIAHLTTEDDEPTPLETRLSKFGKLLAILAVALFGVVLVVGWARSLPMAEVLMVAISQIVSVVPEGLPIALTVALAVGMRRMVQHKALVRRLSAVETLGCTTVICTDKTGTLTKNEMTVTAAWTPAQGRLGPDALARLEAEPAGRALLDAAIACNDAHLEGDQALGDPTELALLNLARQVGHTSAAPARLGELPFDSTSRMMATAHDGVVFIKGAPDAVATLCAPSDPALASASAMAGTMAGEALRVLAFAKVEGALNVEQGWQGLMGRARLLGLCGELDPPRDGVAEAVRQCQRAGVRVIMLTGDHRQTGLAMARALGIATKDEEAVDLATTPLEEALVESRHCTVFARVQPEQKLRIVEALQARGEVVAMTGDGVNDAPALVRADVGVAMGRGGTQVAREAADLVITDDDFASIVRAVEEGRIVYRNIKKATLLLLASSFAEMVILLVAMAVGLPMPFAAVQILWNNLVTEGTITLNLVMEPGEGDELKHPPIPRNEAIVTRAMWGRLLFLGLVMAGVVLGFYAWRSSLGLPHAQVQTETFTLLAVCEWFNVLNCRSNHTSVFKTSLLKNRWLLGGLVVSNALQAAVIFIPQLNHFFHTVALALSEVFLIGAVASVMLWAEEARKYLARRQARPR